MKSVLVLWMACLAVGLARADAVQSLREFVRDVKAGGAEFTQAVTSADGAKTKMSSGQFEFSRPNRFRFDYIKPYPQHIVADGERIWVHDPDLNQVSVRPIGQALGQTPAALLAGGALDSAFVLTGVPARAGLEWARATPRSGDGGFQWMEVGFDGRTLAAVEILDAFGQRSLLRFTGFAGRTAPAPERFRFTPPPGADLLVQ